MSQITFFDDMMNSSPALRDFSKRFKTHYKSSSIWTLETGCLLFTSWMIYYLIFVSPEVRGVLDIIVLVFFFVGALIYVGTSSLFSKINDIFYSNSNQSESNWTHYLKKANRYLFMVLSFLPGIYFAFKYEHFILRYYIVIHMVTSVYFLYKRYNEFELEPFLIGLGMSAALYFVGPFLRFIFGGFGSFLESILDLALAVAFLLRLPQKHLPPNMMFGLKLVKYFMCFLSWQTWFTLMIFATWNNLGAAALAIGETYRAIEVQPTPPPGLSAREMDNDGFIKTNEKPKNLRTD